MLLTIFSSVDYCGNENNGGIAIVKKDENNKNNIDVQTFYYSPRQKIHMIIPADYLDIQPNSIEINDLHDYDILNNLHDLQDFNDQNSYYPIDITC